MRRRSTSLLIPLLIASVAASACGRRTGLHGDDAGRDVPPGTAGSGGAGGKDGGQSGGGVGTGAAAGANGIDASPDDATLPAPPNCPVHAYPRDGACMCPMTTPVVCPNPCFGPAEKDRTCAVLDSEKEGICVDTLTDPDHCGACGMKCPVTSVCAKGVCGPTPTLAVPPVNGCTTLSLAVRGGNLYWADAAHGTVNRVPTAGGAVVTRGGLPGASRLQAFGDSIYWIVPPANTLLKMPLQGTAPALVVTIPDADDTTPAELKGLHGFTVADDGTAYVSSGTHIYEVSSPGAPARVVVEQIGGDMPGALALDGKTIVFPLLLDGKVNAVALPGPGEPPAQCWTNRPGLPPACWIAITHEPLRDIIFARNGHAFIAESLDRAIETIATAGGNNRDRIGYLPDLLDRIEGFTIQGDWLLYVAGGYVARAPLVVDSQATALVRNQPLELLMSTDRSRVSIAADDTEVFWTTLADAKNGAGTCTIQRLKYR